MKKILENKTLLLLIAFVAGALLMDYVIYMKSKDLNYTKIGGFFKYTAKGLEG